MQTAVFGLMDSNFVFQFIDPFSRFQYCWTLRVQGIVGAGHSPIMKRHSVLLQKCQMSCARSGYCIHTCWMQWGGDSSTTSFECCLSRQQREQLPMLFEFLFKLL